MNAARIIVGAIISGVGLLYLLFAFAMLGWGWSDSGGHWSAVQWTLTIIPWSLPFLFSLWLVHRCVGSSLKRMVLAESFGIAVVSLWLMMVFYLGGEPRTLLEQGTPLVEATNHNDRVPNLPLRYPAVGTELPDGKFDPIMFLTTGDSGNGYKEPFSQIGPKLAAPKIKIFRGTNDVAAENVFLGEYEIVDYGKIKRPMELWFFFSLDEQKRLFVQARAVDKTSNEALKLRRISK